MVWPGQDERDERDRAEMRSDYDASEHVERAQTASHPDPPGRRRRLVERPALEQRNGRDEKHDRADRERDERGAERAVHPARKLRVDPELDREHRAGSDPESEIAPRCHAPYFQRRCALPFTRDREIQCSPSALPSSPTRPTRASSSSSRWRTSTASTAHGRTTRTSSGTSRIPSSRSRPTARRRSRSATASRTRGSATRRSPRATTPRCTRSRTAAP